MHPTLFVYPAALARYRAAPLLAERERFLVHCERQGYRRKGLRKIAWLLLIIASTRLALSRWATADEIEQVARRHRVRFIRHGPGRGNCRTTQRLIMHTAVTWYGFLGRLAPRKPSRGPFSVQLDAFEQYMYEERGLSGITIATRRQQIARFLSNLPGRTRSPEAITLLDVDRPPQVRLEPCIAGDSGQQPSRLLPLRGDTALVQAWFPRGHRLSAPLRR